MNREQARAIARTPDAHPEEYARLVTIAVILDADGTTLRYGVEFVTDYQAWTEYDHREARESLRQLR
jgi:hypothetical protein